MRKVLFPITYGSSVFQNFRLETAWGAKLTAAPRTTDWGLGLLGEIFEDPDGDARPVTVILVNDDTLTRAAEKAHISFDGSARDAFLKSFPDRAVMAKWFSGSSDPGPYLVAFLMLCCFAASEAADLEANDYRKRLAELLHWEERIHDCQALPSLWRRLERLLGRSEKWRSLQLPDPGFRSIIGHAIELAFPSRPDINKIRTLLEGRSVEKDKPESVISFLMTASLSRNFTSSFITAFNDFAGAWQAGRRALADDRFWVGWQSVTATEPEVGTALSVISDEYGCFRLLDADDRPVDFLGGLRKQKFSRELAFLIEAGRPLYLSETAWGHWAWKGDGSIARRSAGAALIFDRNFRGGRLEQFNRHKVLGAEGWSFTTALSVLLTSDEQRGRFDEDLFNPSISGIVRVDGGILCRPTLPVTIRSDVKLKVIEIAGENREHIHVSLGTEGTSVSVDKAITSNNVVSIKSEASGETVKRALRLRASALAPKFLDAPSRLTPEMEKSLADFSPTSSRHAHHFLTVMKTAESIAPVVLDLIELLACRTGPIPIGELYNIIQCASGDIAPTPWDILHAFFEARIIRPFKTVGWGGRCAMATEPSAVIGFDEDGPLASFEGVVNECLRARLEGAARQEGLVFTLRNGATPWSPPTPTLRGEQLPPLEALIASFGIKADFLAGDLSRVHTLCRAAPNQDGRNHPERERHPVPSEIHGKGFTLHLCRREANDGPRLWLSTDPDGTERYFANRNDALLDLHLGANVSAFHIIGDRLVAAPWGCRLPLSLARWVKLATATCSGPDIDGYAYAVSFEVGQVLRHCLGRLLMPETSHRPAKPQSPRRAKIWTGRTMAFAGGGTVHTVEPWRWARQARGN